jgi:glycosyltransferase involved in cell wall biosynthesis
MINQNGRSHLREVAPESDEFLRVLFVHPSYPSQFANLGNELNQHPNFQCFALAHEACGPMIRAARPGMPYFLFRPDGEANPYSYPFALPFEAGMRNGRGIAQTFVALDAAYHFDAVVGHAAFGSTLHLRDLTNAAVISYAELPGYQSMMARPEFPITFDMLLSSQSYKALLYASMMHSDLCVAPSEHAKRLLPCELQHKTRVQMEGFTVAAGGGQEERAALGLPLDVPLVGFFGRTLEAIRGFDIFVQSAKRLREIEPTVQFLVIGDEQTIYGSERMYLGQVSFKSYALAHAGLSEDFFHWRSGMPYDAFRRHISCLDLAVLPLFEGAANWNLFEAMAVGLPIVSSNRGYVPEAIRDGQDGLLADPSDVEQLTLLSGRLLKDRRLANQLGNSAQQRIHSNYSNEVAAKGYARIIREAISLRRARSEPNEVAVA